jgi:hypothetical protein
MLSYSAQARTTKLVTTFGTGAVREFKVEGFDECASAGDLDDQRYRGNSGPMSSHVECSLGTFRLAQPLTLTWRLRYEVPVVPR